MRNRVGRSRIGTAVGVLCGLLVVSPVFAQTEQEDRVRDLLRRFDDRVGEVGVLVESSRIPAANDLLVQARGLRRDAESQLRGGNITAAFNLATRALEVLKQAENAARAGGSGGRDLEQVNRLLTTQRQQLQDTQRLIDDLEIQQTNDSGVSDGALSILERQQERTQALLEEAEDLCANNTPNPVADVNAARCQELIQKARNLFRQAGNLVTPSAPLTALDDRAVENRLRDARRIVDRTQSELDQIERELNAQNVASAGSLLQRLRNVNGQIRLANDRLESVNIAETGIVQNQTSTALGLLRRASELARSVLAIAEGTGALAREEYEKREPVVESLADRVHDLLDNAEGLSSPDYDRAIETYSQAQQSADSGNYSEALRLLSQAATQLNRALADLGANTSNAARLEVLNRLQDQYDRVRGKLLDSTVAGDSCGQYLAQADSLRSDSERQERNGNLVTAFTTINRAQRKLAQAADCLGIDTSRIQTLLDRLQDEYDRRRSGVEDGVDPAASVLLNESDSLRDLSDAQESQGQRETAVQTVGRAISTLGNAQRLLTDNLAGREEALLDRLQNQFDRHLPKVVNAVDRANTAAASSFLIQATSLRQQSEDSANAGQIRQGLSQIGRAIQLIERATVTALNAVNATATGVQQPSF